MASCGRTCQLLFAVVAVLLAILCVPDPDSLGKPAGIWVRTIRSFFKVVFFTGLTSPASVFPQITALDHVVKGMKEYRELAGEKGSRARAEKVLEIIDTKAWEGNMLINIGDTKGKILDQAILNRTKPAKLAVELGTFIGYGTVRMTRLMAEDTEVMTVDPCALAYAVASSILEQAGIRHRVTMMQDYSTNVFRKLAADKRKIDILFIDHIKNLYLPDLKLALELDLFEEDATIIGDNIVFPGAPDFKEFLLSDEGRAKFTTVVYDSHVEYMPSVPDQVTVSTFTR